MLLHLIVQSTQLQLFLSVLLWVSFLHYLAILVESVPGATLDVALMMSFSYLEQKLVSFSFALDPVGGV